MTKLVLSRKLNEQIRLQFDDETSVLITVKRIDRNQVRLLFDAPLEVIIQRSELDKFDLD
jgi:carbon storage regulator CsrA